ncbi:glycine-rich protein [Segatella albensis]|uniref:glycine-rich protein n=1 Tax=Segatella albensis TaxID=77768 RepID=UPI0006864D99|nr:glycine-rich protein [Segatella albensis]
MQTFIAPVTGNYKLEVWGGQGMRNYSGIGGKGGYSYGNYNGGGNLYVCVGRQGDYYSAYNGGMGGVNGQCGGGATHIATSDRGELKNYESYQSEVLLVAGGGGGANDIGRAGVGGGLSGGSGEQVTYLTSTIKGASGGTQNSGGTYSGVMSVGDSPVIIISGSFGQGGRAYIEYTEGYMDYGGGGGGGWYGGGGTPFTGTGGGGSGHINTTLITNGATIAGDQTFPSPSGGTETGHSGNGYCIISWISPSL